ncbi:unnamed protein product (macronuclear) [Paramecium tetraurelia]|uniref:Zinc finger ZPR1-type domain-containing protein n=1 Tax=Paramecium tetraurelia TaxID=5888 RepID=A0CYL3_PARTE|nr:uncharacterized protein GSPATT00011481001 [Paramecium tetraurelia]CAK75880.1 unnamed protein product [Paramecium tetraurelia]|eukprot:XP_001443277.1 hypothetical protein (macronuclear) [Paramecium tetraurelia strain d4-2]
MDKKNDDVTKEILQQINLNNQDLNSAVKEQFDNDGVEFSNHCNQCGQLGINKMCKITIPYVRDLIIMSFTCNECGYRDTEIKGANGITPQGKLFRLYVNSQQDLKRNVFKSETASLQIPEIELEMCTGTLGAVFTTTQGIVSKVLDHLRDKTPIYNCDDPYRDNKLQKVFDQLQAFHDGTQSFTLIIRDLIDSSFVSNVGEPDTDYNLQVIAFDRSEEDDDELGIDTMNTENYF